MSAKSNAVVFSDNNPAQLSLFLESFSKNIEGIDLTVLYSSSDEECSELYDRVKKDYGDFFFFEYENFKEDLLSIMNVKEYDYFTLFLDDDIIYDKFAFNESIYKVFDDGDVFCFSLRMGKNIDKCFTLGGAANVMHDIKEDGDLMSWDWKLHYLDFGYPIAPNGHIFRRKDIYKLTRKSKFMSIADLEAELFDLVENFPRNKMYSHAHSKLVNFPIARLQESIESESKAMAMKGRANRFKKAINKSFSDGDFIKLENLDFSEINSCHKIFDIGIEIEEVNEKDIAEKIGNDTQALDSISTKRFGRPWDELKDNEKKQISDSLKRISELFKEKNI